MRKTIFRLRARKWLVKRLNVLLILKFVILQQLFYELYKRNFESAQWTNESEIRNPLRSWLLFIQNLIENSHFLYNLLSRLSQIVTSLMRKCNNWRRFSSWKKLFLFIKVQWIPIFTRCVHNPVQAFAKLLPRRKLKIHFVLHGMHIFMA